VATLAVYRGDQFLRRIELQETPLRIGRAPENELVLGDPNKGVSRAHAEIRYERGCYVVVDLDSQNGVWLGKRRVRRDQLPVDVPLTIGPYRLVLEETPQQTHADESAESPGSAKQGRADDADPTHLPSRADTNASTPGTLPAQLLPRKRRLAMTLGIGGVAVLLVVAVILAKNLMPGRSTLPVGREEPAPPTPEQRFEEKFKLAQAYLEKRDKDSATKANEDALRILPGDSRGLKQQQEIAALEEAPTPAPPEPPVPVPPSGPANPETPPPPRPTSTLTIANIKGESPRDRANRDKEARSFLDDGKARFREGQYSTAIMVLEAALRKSGRPDYGSTAYEARQLIDQARESIEEREREQRAKRIQDQLTLAEQRAAAGDIVGEMRALQEVKRLDPGRPAIDDRIGKLQERARVEGEKAFLDARNYDARRGRGQEALASFERAVQLFELVPGGSENLEYARRRRDELRAQQ
jgi:pSer/pThr/pTyr-binding forkhead associated (FHA) protein